jgi:hypothetical protein
MHSVSMKPHVTTQREIHPLLQIGAFSHLLNQLLCSYEEGRVKLIISYLVVEFIGYSLLNTSNSSTSNNLHSLQVTAVHVKSLQSAVSSHIHCSITAPVMETLYVSLLDSCGSESHWLLLQINGKTVSPKFVFCCVHTHYHGNVF